MVAENEGYQKSLVDLPHFTADKKLSSALKFDPAEDNEYMWCSLQKGSDKTGDKQKITTKLNRMEVAYIVMQLQGWLIRSL